MANRTPETEITSDTIVQRVRAIILTDANELLFIKRVKPGDRAPYWVAPGGGVELYDPDLQAALERELCEELGATVEILGEGFVLEHRAGGKNLREHFFICRLLSYDLSLRHGPEFDDPSRGEYIPDTVPLEPEIIHSLNIKTIEFQDWLIANADWLREL